VIALYIYLKEECKMGKQHVGKKPLKIKVADYIEFDGNGFGRGGGINVVLNDKFSRSIMLTNLVDYNELKDAPVEDCINYVKTHYHGVLIAEPNSGKDELMMNMAGVVLKYAIDTYTKEMEEDE
jgi:hypothetical protein